jgi:LysM repeat protein
LDCAAATGNGQLQDGSTLYLTSVPGGGQAGASQFMVPVVISTANANGDVFHKVQYGQSLWSIAIEYGTTIKSIQALNNLGEDLVVYPGQELLVLKGAAPPSTSTFTAVPTNMPASQMPAPEMLAPSQPTVPPAHSPTVPVTGTPAESPASSGAPSSGLLVGILIVAAFIGGGVAVWLIRDPN